MRRPKTIRLLIGKSPRPKLSHWSPPPPAAAASSRSVRSQESVIASRSGGLKLQDGKPLFNVGVIDNRMGEHQKAVDGGDLSRFEVR